jgi:uncharacterized protein YkwD
LLCAARPPDHDSVHSPWLALAVLVALTPTVLAQPQAATCAPDDHLSLAAAELLLASRTKPDAQQLMAAVRAADSDAVGVHALFAPAATPDAPQAWLSQLREHADGPLVCGSAAGEAGRLWIASVRAGALQPLDLHKRVVRGELSAGFDRAELVVAAADGHLARVGVSAAALRAGVGLDDDLDLTDRPLPWSIQLVATGPSGPRPIAERRLPVSHEPVDASAASSPDAAPAPVSTKDATKAAADDSRELTRLVLDLRADRDRPRLRDNRLLRQAAHEHALAVCNQGRLAHELTKGAGPPERLAHTGLSARLVGEAIARSASPNAALDAFQRSPSHLLTLLEPRFTDFGVGVAIDPEGQRCFVVMLCAWPRPLGRRAALPP